MKQCITCNQILPLADFAKYARSKDGLQARCRTCKRAYDNDYYKRVPERKTQITSNRDANKTTNMQYVYTYLLEHPCEFCGETDYRVLQFDHLNPAEKSYNVSAMYGYGIETLKAEIAKCRVLCANCHMRHTAEQLGWYKRLTSVG